MNFEDFLSQQIESECKKLIDRYHAYHNNLHLNHERNLKRISNAPAKIIKTPDYWKKDKKFNPFYVLKKRKSIALSIAKKIENRTYSPNSPHIKEIPKPDGKIRQVSVYQIPDAVVSKVFYDRLLAKNKHRFSSFSYAYRNDRNVHFAIQDISIDLARDARSFIAEFDFSDFFGSSDRSYLENQFSKNGFFITEEERYIIAQFLAQQPKGIPQGTSISLFLANLVCWQLDLQFERLGVKFARYADDTIIWTPDYQKICDAFTTINNFSAEAGVPINVKKSEGISLLTKKGLPAEFKNTKSSVDFLGYSISVDEVSIKPSAVLKIKKQISYILYRNLIQPLKGSVLKGLVIPANDKDEALLTSMSQIRRYMYGGLSGQQIRNYLSGRTNAVKFKGIMSFYPLVNDTKQLRELDGWLVSVIHRAIQLRGRLLKNWRYDRWHIFPFNCKKEDYPYAFRRRWVNGKMLLEIPSFMLIYHALQKDLFARGIEYVMDPKSLSYHYYGA